LKTFTKESLVSALVEIRHKGWIPNARQGNTGGIGNTLEDLLGIRENNLPIPNAAEWELKCGECRASSLLTLFHREPSPQGCHLVSEMLLPKYGWVHKGAGTAYSLGEMSFRQTITATRYSDRGFRVMVDRTSARILVSFAAERVDVAKHSDWLQQVATRAGLGELSPQPYWGLADLRSAAGDKLHNCFFVQADTRTTNGVKHFWYKRITILERFDFDSFVNLLEEGALFIDFDARSGHNHGTKFRIVSGRFPELYHSQHEVEF